MATIIKGSTKRGEDLLWRARHNEGRNLWDVYGNVSSAKMRAYDECLDWYRQDDGENFRIVFHNSFQFSVAWEMTYEGKPATRIETASNSYIVLREV